MKAKKSKRLPRAVSELQEQVQRWRESRARSHDPMPPALWETATTLARKHNVHLVSRACSLGYAKLKRLAQQAPSSSCPAPAQAPLAKFVPVEVSESFHTPLPLPQSQTRVELSAPDGSKMTLHLHDEAQVLRLAQMLWGRAS